MGFLLSITKNQRGFSLLQMLIFVGVAAATNIALMQMISNQYKMQDDIHVKTSALAVRQNLIGLISNQNAWSSTRAKQSFMQCKTMSGFCSSTNPAGPKREIDLYSSAGTLLHSSAPTSGYTSTGEPCNNFSPTGNPLCPLKFKVSWRASCTARTCTPTKFEAPELVSIEFIYAPGVSKPMPFNAKNYELAEQNRLVFASNSSPALDCALKNKIYIGLNTSFNGFAADTEGCADYAAFLGPQGPQGPPGPPGNMGPQGPAGPQGPQGATKYVTRNCPCP